MMTAQTLSSLSPSTSPLTERILTWLPGSRGAKLIIWSSIPIVRALMLALAMELSGHNTLGWWLLFWVIPEFVLVYAILHAIHSSKRLVCEMEDLGPMIVRLIGHKQLAPIFRGLGNTAGPLLMATAVALILVLANMPLTPWWATLIGVPLNLAIYLPLATLVWTYLMLMTGLNRLGKEHLALETYNGDRSLGLRPVGKLAFSGFWTFVANLGPVTLFSLMSRLALALALVFFIAGLVVFFFSLGRLHRQMMRARRQQIERARELYTQAYAPLSSGGNLESLREQAPLLSAAEALERRASAIQVWPFDEGILVRIFAIATAVLTAIVTRLALKPLGL